MGDVTSRIVLDADEADDVATLRDMVVDDGTLVGEGERTIEETCNDILDLSVKSSALASELNRLCMHFVSLASRGTTISPDAEMVDVFELVESMSRLDGSSIARMADVVGRDSHLFAELRDADRSISVDALAKIVGSMGLELHVVGRGHDWRLLFDDSRAVASVNEHRDDVVIDRTSKDRRYMKSSLRSRLCHAVLLESTELFCQFGHHMTLADAVALCSSTLGVRIYPGGLRSYVESMDEFEMVRFGKIWLIRYKGGE